MESHNPRGEDANPYAPPLVEAANAGDVGSGMPVRRDGDLVVVTRGSFLSERCVVCNQIAARVQSRKLPGYSVPFRAEWIVLLLPLVGGIAAGFLSMGMGIFPAIFIVPLVLCVIFVAVVGNGFFGHRPRIYYSICPRHWWATLATRNLVWVGIAFVGTGVLTVNQALAGRGFSGWLGILFLAIGFTLGVVRIMTAFHSFLPRVQRRHGGYFWLSGFGPRFLASLPTVSVEDQVDSV